MGRSYVRLLGLLVLGTSTVPVITYLASRRLVHENLGDHPVALLLLIPALIVPTLIRPALNRLGPWIESESEVEARFLESIPDQYLRLTIFVSAAASILLELAVIRWQASVLELFAFYKNFSLLACFAGLGLGYAMGRRKSIALVLTIPLLCWQFVLLIGLRYGLAEQNRLSLKVLPFSEQLNIGLPTATTMLGGMQAYLLLMVIFLLTALAFIPVGQLCGYLLDRSNKLSGYGANLAGSIAGVLVMFALSKFWTPPVVWFLPVFAVLLAFHQWSPRQLFFGSAWVVLAVIVLSWPVNPGWQRIYSPYQLLEVGHDKRGLMLVLAAGHYYQQAHDLARSNRNLESDPELRKISSFYELPYRVFGRAPGSVIVVGAGSGNDVAAALRNGAGSVDAVEIDPAILLEGKGGHPEHPYGDPRVHAVVNDARSYLRQSRQSYDMVVYGFLDSHTLLSHGSSVRLDSFVYTVEGLRDARRHLKPDGMLSLSFSVMDVRLGRKLYLMLQQVFDGKPPVCVQAGYNDAVIFLESNSGAPQLPPGLLAQTGLKDFTATYANPDVRADVSTDDWPFFYMPQRVYPVSYIVMAGVIVGLTVLLFTRFSEGGPRVSTAPSFFLGAGFMLIETKAITELGLVFGNSWQVIGVVIVAILVMAFLANVVVQRYAFANSAGVYALLLLSLALGWAVARAGGLPSTWLGRTGFAVVLTSPIFFAGMAFSGLLQARGGLASMLAANLLGAMAGGLLEYNSMYFGFRFLYVMAAGLYLTAFLLERLEKVPKELPVAVEP